MVNLLHIKQRSSTCHQGIVTYYFCEDKEKILAVNKLDNTISETSMRIVEGQ